jgi:hypothetical protein
LPLRSSTVTSLTVRSAISMRRILEKWREI